MSETRCTICHPTWKKVGAFLVDLNGSFWLFGYAVAKCMGGLTNNGFELTGWPALLAMSLMFAYFKIMKKYFGGTLGKRLFGIANTNRKK